MNDSTSSQTNTAKPSFLRRIPLAFGAFFRTFSDIDFASRINTLGKEPVSDAAPTPPEPEKAPEVAPPPPLKEASSDAALLLLSLLQRDARLIDFTQENLANYSDAEIGAAARVVHEGCRKVLNEHFSIAPVREDNEGSTVTLQEGFDAAAIRLTGNVVGSAPFRGTLTHRGWRATDVRLPKLAESHDASVLAPAEVEL
ncbi:DUF2760 domain-containing protein [Noviherbaspirillum sp. CPCC 100848]|uniref:DUF2760 domain-containing protein n=1 Tax=Noviherbaspirillum album TaxID=3080276 RepID=A0ABU6JG97_9BURK|nr:DUF2760 domain-containing protein [Noviherbaspirillum sp. CPCC 100848]MEC4722550.1 DUF2760 domain-containing protein [Noviherbaspirillum sp. CPCC 100848]